MVRQRLEVADEPCFKKEQRFDNKYAMWGLAGEVAEWCETGEIEYRLPTANDLYSALFAEEPIEWNRIGAFQVSQRVEFDFDRAYD